MLPAPESKNMLLWVVIAAAVIVIALAYYFYASAPSDTGEMKVPDNMMEDNMTKDNMMPASEEEVIEDELNAMSLDDLDAELTDIDKELAQ